MSRGRIVAVLGPTNTGKTHLAIDRMLGHDSGIIGFPLRLLARENYDRVVARVGRRDVALVTGEEKIVPPAARYFLCTVESMPIGFQAAFLGVDEIQLCADPERGAVFTDRLLHARGTQETMFMGAATIAPLMRRLVPSAQIETRARFSQLSHIGRRKLSRLPRRSAIVGFSVNEVYQVAEHVRRHRGGAAIVLGALSPRTRNAQVELYQSGEVDYLVATDAIGMGLNMDIDHVAFAGLRKFDGRYHRPLAAPELAQIAGRAGRHMSDGTFGTTERTDPLGEEAVEAIETSTFEPVSHIFWRSADLDMRSGKRLLASLERRPPQAELRRGPLGDDQRTLMALLSDDEVEKRARNPEATRLLWDVCRVPDFRKTLAESHTRLVGEIFRQLSSLKGVIDGDWAIGHVNHLDRVDGDIDTLMNRIAHVRTWTYIAHQGTWLPDGQDWQARTRHIEDRLSDALHGALSQRFIDRRSAVLVRQLGDGGPLAARIEKDGEVTLAGEYVGRLSGFSFTPDEAVHREDSKAILAAARRTLGQEINRRLDLLADDPDSTITLQPNGRLNWRGADIARLANGNDLLAPVIMPVSEPLLDKAAIARIEQRLSGWLSARVDRDLAPLRGLSGHELKGAARGIVFQLREEAGSIEREKVASLIADLSGAERAKLRDLGVRIGARFVFIDGAFSLRARRLLAILLGIFRGHALPIGLPPTLPISWRADDDIEPSLLRQIGYPKVGPLAVRVDRLELMLRRAHAASRRADAKADDLARTIGSSPEDLKPVLKEGGFKLVEENGVTKLSILRRKGGRRQRRKANPNSPFADLARLA